MKAKLTYKITGILAAVMAVTALSATAQDATAPAEPAPPATTAPAAPAPDVTTLPPVAPPETTTATPPETTAPATAPTADNGTIATQPAEGSTQVADATADTTVVAPKDFMQHAFLANEFGIAAAQLAVQKAEDAEVKAAAQEVLNNGLKTRTDMVTAIQGSTSDMHFDQAWTDEYKQKLADLQSVEGADFDAKYLATQGEITHSSEQLYNSFATTASDASVKTFASNTLPILTAEGDKLEAASMGGQ